MTSKGIRKEDMGEFVGQIIDVFEDFLDEKGIVLDNPEKEDSECPANIYGTDYGNIQTRLEDLLSSWDLVEDDETTRVRLSIDLECNKDSIDEIKKLEHHVEYLLDLDSYPEIKNVFNAKVKEI